MGNFVIFTLLFWDLVFKRRVAFRLGIYGRDVDLGGDFRVFSLDLFISVIFILLLFCF